MNAETDYTSKFLETVRREQYAFVTDADEISWIKSPANRMKLVRAGVFVKAGKNGALVIYRSTVPADEVTEFIENGDASGAVVKPPPAWTVTAGVQTAKTVKTEQHHTYIPPAVASDIQRILTDELSQVLWLTGPTQCLAPETEIRVNRSNDGTVYTIEKLYKLFHGLLPRSKYIPTFVRSYKEDKNSIGLNLALDVVENGVREIGRLVLEDGHSIRLTPDHRVMTRRGFVEAGKLVAGQDEVMTDSVATHGLAVKGIKDAPRKAFGGCRYHPHAHVVHTKRDGVVYKVREYRAVYDAQLNGLTVEEFLKIVRNDEEKAKTLVYSSPLDVIHHVNGDSTDNSIGNLVLMTHAEHDRVHNRNGNFGQGVPSYSKVVSFNMEGKSVVYDIKCNDPYHNFVANGIVVHNCGKDKVVHYVAEMCLGRKVFQVNCRGDMDSSVFLGEKTVDIDRATAQNFVRFQKGMIELAMTEGLKKDENGNEVFDENGNVIVEGKPGVLFIDEAAAMPAHVAIALNRLLESDDNVRTFVIDNDGGREVKSHPDFRIVFASNTVGRGASDLSSNMYTAQNDSLDVSLLNRVTSFIRMGYSRTAEQKILREKIRDDKEVRTLLDFRDKVRAAIRSGKLMSMLSTAHLIHIADNFRIFDRDMPKAIYYAVFNSLLPEEKAVYSEFISALWGVTSLEQSIEDSGVDYF